MSRLPARRVRWGAPGLVAWLLLAAGCARWTGPPGLAPVLDSAPPRFELSGRWSLVRAGRAYHGHIEWHQRGDSYRLTLQGPLGQGGLRLDGGGEGVVMTLADGRTDRARDAETLLERHLGAPVPVAGLRYWVVGRPDPGRPSALQIDDAGHLQALRQDGWEVRYLDFTESAAGRTRPRRLEARYGRDLRLKLVVDAWRGDGSIPSGERPQPAAPGPGAVEGPQAGRPRGG